MIYLTYGTTKSRGVPIYKKIVAQMKVFRKYFPNAMWVDSSYGRVYLYDNTDKVIEKKTAVTWEEQFTIYLRWIEKYGISKVYLRHKWPTDYWLLDFLRGLKDKKIRFVMEFPSFPYKGKILNSRIIMEDDCFCNELKNYVDICTSYCNLSEAFGIPIISLQNGVNIGEHRLRTVKSFKNDEIVLLTVSTIFMDYGFERLIWGIYNYYSDNKGKYRFRFLLVGDGDEVPNLKKLISELKLERDVLFLGYKTGKELDEIYDMADIGVASLGFYKSGIFNAGPIKTREFCARGLPFIYGYDDMGFSGDEVFNLSLPNSDEPINMYRIIELYESTVAKKSILYEMRQYAIDNFTWDNILKPVINYYQKGNI